MKKKVFVAIATVLALIVMYFVGSGFMKNTSAIINDYRVSADGKEITLNIGVASSIGYIRDVKVHQQYGGKLYLDCYSAFGGSNGSRLSPPSKYACRAHKKRPMRTKIRIGPFSLAQRRTNVAKSLDFSRGIC